MITRAVERAYQVMTERKWDTVYWAIDLHGTVLGSTYNNGAMQFINSDARRALQYISNLPESKIILWSSLHDPQWEEVKVFFETHGIKVHYINCNPEVENTEVGNFSSKFYFSVLVDDKAGFSPNQWMSVAAAVERCTLARYKLGRY